IRKHERQRDLIQLQATANWAAIDPGVLRKAAVGLLLHLEEVIKRAIGAVAIAHGDKCGCHLIKIACPNRVVAADRRLVSVWPTTPRDRWRSDHRAAIGFVFQRLQSERSDVEL